MCCACGQGCIGSHPAITLSCGITWRVSGPGSPSIDNVANSLHGLIAARCPVSWPMQTAERHATTTAVKITVRVHLHTRAPVGQVAPGGRREQAAWIQVAKVEVRNMSDGDSAFAVSGKRPDVKIIHIYDVPSTASATVPVLASCTLISLFAVRATAERAGRFVCLICYASFWTFFSPVIKTLC